LGVWVGSVITPPFALACTRSSASRTAAQPSIAHFTLAGNWATPSNATASPNVSSSSETFPCPWIIFWKPSYSSSACCGVPPITSSDITDVDACEIEQPIASYDTSPIAPSATLTRSDSSSPQDGFTW